MSTFFVGLGQNDRHAALAVIEQVEADQQLAFHWRHAQTFPLHATFAEIVQSVKERLSTEPLRDNSVLLCDTTIVGRPFADMLIAADIKTYSVGITSGDSETMNGRFWSIPRRSIVTATQALLQLKRLIFAAHIPDLSSLQRDLWQFQTNDSADNPLAVAVALPCRFVYHRNWRRLNVNN